MLGIYQQVYEARHRVWSYRGLNIACNRAPMSPTAAGGKTVQSDDEEQREKMADKEYEKRDDDEHVEGRAICSISVVCLEIK